MEVQAAATYEYDALRALVHLSAYRKANPKTYLIAWVVSSLLFITAITFFLVFVENDIYMQAMLIVFVLIICFNLFFYFMVPKTHLKAQGSHVGIKNLYIFRDDELEVKSSGKDINGCSTLKYTTLFKVMETSKYFFLFQYRAGAFIVDKSTIEDGTADDIRKVLSDALGKKYIRCRY